MSRTSIIDEEIHRFLDGDDAEILCIKGKWGVGKTTKWSQTLDDFAETGKLRKQRYSYVSLFGLNSLSSFRNAIFEQTVGIDDSVASPSSETLIDLFKNLPTNWRKLTNTTRGLLEKNTRLNDNVVASSTFFFVRNQLICIDDIERAGDGLRVQDVLGLALFLKEERKCKVVLLLNDEEIKDGEKGDFAAAIEKVADVALQFEPSIEEALDIAFREPSKEASLIRPKAELLNITNIRVLKKIERLVSQLLQTLVGYDDAVLEQAVRSAVLGCWSTLQPQFAPPLDFVRKHNSYSRLFEDDIDPQVGGEEQEWRSILRKYQYDYSDELDLAIFDAVEAGYLSKEEITVCAKKVEQQILHAQGGASFSAVWRDLYHGSLATSDQEFGQALFDAATNEAEYITPLNLNSAIRVLRQIGENQKADDLVDWYVEARSGEGLAFFDLKSQHFLQDEQIDKKLEDAFNMYREDYQDTRDPLLVLLNAAPERNWTDEDKIFISKMTSKQIEDTLEGLCGPNLHVAIDTILMLCRGNYPEAQKLKDEAQTAFENIANKHSLNREKLNRLGVQFPQEIQVAAD
ncbi:hypothetical protein [Ruegeria arenilitoris]|uniref:hypothetical protein n=1 Tax=Ruegeria arenilitoris TaxID=1173585 RepID=UPI00147F4586|nr:hypothetical protein [Ruegeria arenilitoris]